LFHKIRKTHVFCRGKKTSVDIKKDPYPAFQLRSYAWSADLSVSILTNFEVLAIYESRKKPKETDRANTELLISYTYKQYVENWNEIANIFSKKAVYDGSLDRFAELSKSKHGTQDVGDEFLKEIEGWRKELAQNIAIRNTNLLEPDINFSVQSTIDRIIFLRMCEDRGIEKYEQLLALLEHDNIYANLCKIFQKCDEKYNSGLFHFKKEKGWSTPPDDISLNLKIDDKVLEHIIKHIYPPKSPYQFSVFKPEILGNVYEQFLGKVIHLTEGHHVRIEDKPEVKKAGGVYYTPEYVVEYIVENTVGKLCTGKTPKQIENLHILDPACGSGSFLLGAYSYLLKYHLEYYTKRKNPHSYKDQIYQGKEKQWFLTTKEKKRILLNNIYGIDIDNQAVEVTKLSLLLKVLEGENKDVSEWQKKL
jgi:type I restriction-modification system DNA methylase subunit